MFSEGVMWRLVLVVSLLCCSSEASVSCRDENGAEVERCKDQPPKINGKEKSVPQPRDLSEVAAVDVQKRVYKGRDCTDAEGRHYVALVPAGYTLVPPGIHISPGITRRFCGGNLISNWWILTARHCDRDEFDVILGSHSLFPAQRMEIRGDEDKHYYVVDNHRHDIMLVRLPRAATTLPTITLPLVGCTSAYDFNADYTLIGWSYTDVNPITREKNQRLAVNLQCGDVKLHRSCTRRNQNLTIQTMSNNIRIIRPYINHHLLCTNDERLCGYCINGGTCGRCPPNRLCESCPGDSGGSLVKRDGNVDVLVGVTIASGTTPSGFTLYMDVCAYRDWIRRVTRL